jgi:hypothetical protein
VSRHAGPLAQPSVRSFSVTFRLHRVQKYGLLLLLRLTVSFAESVGGLEAARNSLNTLQYPHSDPRKGRLGDDFNPIHPGSGQDQPRIHPPLPFLPPLVTFLEPPRHMVHVPASLFPGLTRDVFDPPLRLRVSLFIHWPEQSPQPTNAAWRGFPEELGLENQRRPFALVNSKVESSGPAIAAELSALGSTLPIAAITILSS